ncbi:hypothetical protein JTE90_015325 [Oedothorax gibbosus]|uniref:Uncharacterized protein n=1 Tax=Oedothorax gibbosus TaxID=931172 RepID=A0AAV6VNV3_9ARAC|nr:hypothetical protein JTE90_015325 [Oedothorax gibbosus]
MTVNSRSELLFLLSFTSILYSVCDSQVLRNRYSGIFKDDERHRQYPHDYYDRYPDRYNTWDSQHVPTGFNSIYSDSRCIRNRPQQLTDNSSVLVKLRLGIVVGTYVYLCDGPGVTEYDRPDTRLNQSPKVYKNLTIFLGIPYALPPTPEEDRRLRVCFCLF